MPERHSISAIVVTRLRALLPEDWLGKAGRLFRQGTDGIASAFEDAGIPPRELPNRAIALAVDKVEGLAQKDKAAALRDFSEAEERKIDAQLKARSLESRVRKEEAEAALAEINALNARLDLEERLTAAGVVIRRDQHGNFIVSPIDSSRNLGE
jgi:hypothetical protein